ncbi:hypothetical protein HZ994_09800 [Akkermansiaceae bacterium]|nr:hypothetical protein HZ994_09800 [Akkermansiaceae bacterium]
MIPKLPLALAALLVFPISGSAQEEGKPSPVQVRAVLHDPANPSADLFYTDEAGTVVKLEFRPHDLTEPLPMLPLNGSLVLYDKAEIDPGNPAASLAASAKLPAGTKRAMVVVMPGPADEKPPYRMLVIDDSQKAFPYGESRVLGLIGVETAIQAGEHRLPVHPGKITRVPPVRKVNDFNMAQTNFYFLQGDAWMPFTERQLQYLDASRRLFIVHATPGATAPKVTTIVDTARPGAAQ